MSHQAPLLGMPAWTDDWNNNPWPLGLRNTADEAFGSPAACVQRILDSALSGCEFVTGCTTLPRILDVSRLTDLWMGVRDSPQHAAANPPTKSRLSTL